MAGVPGGRDSGKKMDKDFVTTMENTAGHNDFFLLFDYNTVFVHDAGITIVKRRGSEEGDEAFEYRLKPMSELFEGDRPFDASNGDDWSDVYLSLLVAIETAIMKTYGRRPEMKDKQVINVMTRLVAKPEMHLGSELALAIQDHLLVCLSGSVFSRKEVIGALRKVLKSAKRHHSIDGTRGYLEFIKDAFGIW
jgi:hypothetical protein